MNTSQRRKSGVRSPGVKNDAEGGRVSLPSIVAIVLCLILPPVGLLMLWRQGMFKLRGRLIFTGVAFISLVVFFSVIRTGAAPLPSTVVPVPNVPALRTVSPNKVAYVDKVVTEATPGPTLVPYDEEIEYAVYVTPAPTQNVGDQVVFAVFNNAVYYHADAMCGQTNRRTLTVSEAVAEGLKPCSRCNPPTF